MINLLKFKSFNESRVVDLIKRLDTPIPIVGVTDINPVEHKILMTYFNDYSWLMAFDAHNRLLFTSGRDFTRGGDRNAYTGLMYVTKEDIHLLMSPEDLKLEQMCLSINDLINDVLIEDMETLTTKLTLNSYQYKKHDLITITAIPIDRGDRIDELSVDRIKMFVDLLSDTQKIFKIQIIRKYGQDQSVDEFKNINEFENMYNFKNIIVIRIHVTIR